MSTLRELCMRLYRDEELVSAVLFGGAVVLFLVCAR